MSVIHPSPTIPPSPSTPSSSDWTASPRKRDPNLQPNAHPYAIRTTSTALLSRSGSSASTPVRHFYLPPPPQSPSLSRPGLGHRNTKSLNDGDKLGEALFGVPTMEIPRPLPAPPGQQNRAGSASPTHRMIEANPASTNTNTDGGDNTTPNAQRRIKSRAETLPSLPFTFPGPSDTNGSPDDILAALEHELPSNPKTWTPAQLASYLLTALRVQSPSSDTETTEPSSEPIAPGIARDVASFVRSAAISGRVFLRLNDDDLDELSVPTPWRAPLLAASRALRQNMLRGRIFGFGSPVLGSDENEQYALHSPSSEPSLSAFMSDNGPPLRSPSLARLETGHLRRSRSGRVKGMVQHLERGASGSESDASDASSTSSRPSSPIRPSVLHHHPRGTVARVPSDPPPQYSPFRAPRALPSPPEVPEETESPIVEEQSMQELLAAQGVEPAWGARAWEMEGVGETVKHLPAAATGPAQFGSMRRRELSDEEEHVNMRRSVDDLFTPDTTSLRHSGTAKSISRASGARAFGTASRSGTRAMRGVEGRRLVSALFMPDNAPTNIVAPTDDKAVLAAREAEHAQAAQTPENVQQAEPIRSLPTGLGIDHMPQAFAVPEASHIFEALPEPVYDAQPVSMPIYAPAMPEPEPTPAAVAMPVPVPAVPSSVQEKEEDDETAAHIAALESELSLTRSALDTMRARLSAVEARMDAIDASSAERSAVLSAALEGIKARETELRDACKVAENAQGEAQKAKEEAEKIAGEMKEERVREEARRKERALDKATRHAIVEEEGSLGKVVPGLPRGVAELPQYVLLVGLGVCAVALQVVFGRAGGRRLR